MSKNDVFTLDTNFGILTISWEKGDVLHIEYTSGRLLKISNPHACEPNGRTVTIWGTSGPVEDFICTSEKQIMPFVKFVNQHN